MSADKINQLFWLSYADAVRTKAEVDLSDGKCFFVGSEVFKAPPAGSEIEQGYTNRGIYNIANCLLSTKDLFYSSADRQGYIGALDKCLAWADTEGRPSPQDLAVLTNYQRVQDDQEAQCDRAEERARAKYNNAKAAGYLSEEGMPTPSFSTWCERNAPDYVMATEMRRQAAEAVRQIRSRIDGPKSASISKNQANLDLARASAKNGMNMEAYDGEPPTQMQRDSWKSDPSKKPSVQLEYVPRYDAPDYTRFVANQEVKHGNGNTEDGRGGSIELIVDISKDVSDFAFSQVPSGVGAGANWPGWFTVTIDGSDSESQRKIDTGSETSEVKFKMLFDDVAIVPVTAGSWDFDVSQYKLRKGAPDSLKNLARVSEFIVASRMGFEITLGANLASDVESRIKGATSRGGSMTIFGIPVELSAQGGSTSENASHRAEVSNGGRTIKVVPKGEGHTVTVIGVVGKKLNIRTS